MQPRPEYFPGSPPANVSDGVANPVRQPSRILSLMHMGHTPRFDKLNERFPFTRSGLVQGDLSENPEHTSFFHVFCGFPGASPKSVIIMKILPNCKFGTPDIRMLIFDNA
ncbi:Uncharacterized protein dnm_085520 [Desulfonema magnum]|uniref:Uncharacterized protein n=1 Tax=Desulfonema magnum TaxID=45655 RepID=A0A975GSZ8_9BACT|nr:Uncharacterized protein dnm_085520 [Desulfonema magnum]